MSGISKKMMQAAAGAGAPVGLYVAMMNDAERELRLYENSDGTLSFLDSITTATASYDSKGIAFSPDNKYIAVGDGDASIVRLIDISDPSTIVEADSITLSVASGDIGSLDFNEDGSLLAVGTNESPYFFLLSQSEGTLSVSDDGVGLDLFRGRFVRFIPNSSLIAFGQSAAGTYGPLVALDYSTATSVTVFDDYTGLTSNTFVADISADGAYLVRGNGSNDDLEIYSLSTSSPVFTLSDTFDTGFGSAGGAVAISPDGSYVVRALGADLGIYSNSAGTLTLESSTDFGYAFSEEIGSVSFHSNSDDAYFAALSSEPRLFTVDYSTPSSLFVVDDITTGLLSVSESPVQWGP